MGEHPATSCEEKAWLFGFLFPLSFWREEAMTQKGEHTWDLVVDYHRCPKCGYINESRVEYQQHKDYVNKRDHVFPLRREVYRLQKACEDFRPLLRQCYAPPSTHGIKRAKNRLRSRSRSRLRPRFLISILILILICSVLLCVLCASVFRSNSPT